jgi:hypothetical protein
MRPAPGWSRALPEYARGHAAGVARRGAPPRHRSDGGLYVPEALPEGALTWLRPGGSLPRRPRPCSDRSSRAIAAVRAAGPVPGGVLLLSAPGAAREEALPPRAVPRPHPRPSGLRERVPRRLPAADSSRRAPGRTVLVATSGTRQPWLGFHRQPGVRVVLSYPEGTRLAPRQAHPAGLLGTTSRCTGSLAPFDDCQRMVAAFADPGSPRSALTSANGISLGVSAAARLPRPRGLPRRWIRPAVVPPATWATRWRRSGRAWRADRRHRPRHQRQPSVDMPWLLLPACFALVRQMPGPDNSTAAVDLPDPR